MYIAFKGFYNSDKKKLNRIHIIPIEALEEIPIINEPRNCAVYLFFSIWLTMMLRSDDAAQA